MIHKMTGKQWDTMLAVHCTAPFRLIQARQLAGVLLLLRRRRRRLICRAAAAAKAVVLPGGGWLCVDCCPLLLAAP
jgi:hypothetical protein